MIKKKNTFLISSAIDFFNYKSVTIEDTFFKVQLDYFKSNVDDFFHELQNNFSNCTRSNTKLHFKCL